MQKIRIASLVGAISLVLLISLLVYSQASAQNDRPLTQADLINILIRVLGLDDQLPAAATLSDRVLLLEKLGYMPLGGWQPETILTKEDVATVVAQILRTDVPDEATSRDYIRILTRQGIMASGSPERHFSLSDLATTINAAATMPHRAVVREDSPMPAFDAEATDVGNAMLAPPRNPGCPKRPLRWFWWWWQHCRRHISPRK